MKWTDFIIIFVIIALPLEWMTSIHERNMEQAAYKNLEMNLILDTAVEDAMTILSAEGAAIDVGLKKDQCVEAFYQTVFLNLGILDDPYAKALVDGYIPAIALIDYDGFYILEGMDSLGENRWQPKRFFHYEDSNFVYGFTLGEDVRIYHKGKGSFVEGKQKDLKKEPAYLLLQEDSIFEELRRRTIIDALERELNWCIQEHNKIAREYGISYEFSLPVIEKEDWYNTVDEISMLVFFQGMPMGFDNSYYNHFALGGAHVVKNKGWYLQEDENHLIYYHEGDCPLLTEKSERYNSPIKAAKKGAFPCRECKP